MPTTSEDLTVAWKDLGAGPGMIQVRSGDSVLFAANDTEPASNDAAGVLGRGTTAWDYGGTENMWAKAQSGTAKIVVIKP